MNPANSPNPASPPTQDPIDVLYGQIENDPQFLEEIDKIPFVETPLHTAADAGDIRLATEIINLKPSFGCKLNLQGLSPMHLASQKGHFRVVRCFVSINKDLVRVKGKKGLTPLHHAAENGHTEILAELLTTCPDSIEDLTVDGETALHIAVEKRQFEALQVLVDWLRRSSDRSRKSFLNRKNESGDTVLHVSTRQQDAQTVKFLIAAGIELNAKNGEGSTAMDIVEMPEFANEEIKNMLLIAKAKQGTDVTDALAENLCRLIINSAPKIDDKTSNFFLAVALLIATMSYQSALSPPGGVYQADVSVASTNSNNSTLLVGKSVMSTDDFAFFEWVNTIALFGSTVVIWTLMPTGRTLVHFTIPLATLYFWGGYINALRIISPGNNGPATIFLIFVLVIIVFISYFRCNSILFI